MAARRPDAADRCVAELRAGPAARAPSLRAANAAADHLRAAGWATIPAWEDLQTTQAPPSNGRPEPGTGCPGWQQPATRALHIHYRESDLLPHLTPQCQALLRSQSGPHAAAWLTAIPTEPALTILPDHFHTALRRRLRLPLALAAQRCGGGGSPGCGAIVDPCGDHRAACARSGLLARRAPLIEQAWVRVCREALGGEGRVVPQQWLARTTAPGVGEDDRRRLDLVVYGATRHGFALCCDVTLVSPLRANGSPHPRTTREDGAAIMTARRRKRERYPELLRPGPQRLVVLACEAGGRWAAECGDLIRDLLRVRAPRAPAAAPPCQSGWLGAPVVGHVELCPTNRGCVHITRKCLAQPSPTMGRQRAAAERRAPVGGPRGAQPAPPPLLKGSGGTFVPTHADEKRGGGKKKKTLSGWGTTGW